MVGREEVGALLKQPRVLVVLLAAVAVGVVEVNGRWQQLQAVRKSLHRIPEIEVAVAAVVDLVVVVEQLVVAVVVSVWLGPALVLVEHRVCKSDKFVGAGTRT